MMYSPLSGLPFFAGHAWLDQIAVRTSEHDWTWREVHNASISLARDLRKDQAVCNLCSGYLPFLITWLACLRCGSRQILPPSRGASDLETSLTDINCDVLLISDDKRLLAVELLGVKTLHLVVSMAASTSSDADSGWLPDLDSSTVTLYTSGSTGRPAPRHKSLRQLLVGAFALGHRLESVSKPPNRLVPGSAPLSWLDAMVCSVPVQHMFGIETALMLCLVYGVSVIDSRPLLPADVEVCLGGLNSILWITTPLHLRAMVRSGTSVAGCSLILTSTMQFSADLAGRTERLLNAPAIEIYGSTETGVLATRRTAQDECWQWLDGVDVQATQRGIETSSAHFSSPFQLNDTVELAQNSQFRLLGRDVDLIKVGGRRASLSALNQVLQDCDALDDGVFYLPRGTDTDRRLVLFYCAEAADPEAVKSWLRERVDQVFVPRVTIKVERIPRNDRGKVALGSLDALYDQWMERG